MLEHDYWLYMKRFQYFVILGENIQFADTICAGDCT